MKLTTPTTSQDQARARIHPHFLKSTRNHPPNDPDRHYSLKPHRTLQSLREPLQTRVVRILPTLNQAHPTTMPISLKPLPINHPPHHLCQRVESEERTVHDPQAKVQTGAPCHLRPPTILVVSNGSLSKSLTSGTPAGPIIILQTISKRDSIEVQRRSWAANGARRSISGVPAV